MDFYLRSCFSLLVEGCLGLLLDTDRFRLWSLSGIISIYSVSISADTYNWMKMQLSNKTFWFQCEEKRIYLHGIFGKSIWNEGKHRRDSWNHSWVWCVDLMCWSVRMSNGYRRALCFSLTDNSDFFLLVGSFI